MVRTRHILAILVIFMLLCALAVPANAVPGNGNGKDKHTYIVVYKTKDKKIDTSKQERYTNPVDGKLKYDYKIINAQAVEMTDDQLSKAKARGDVEYVIEDAQGYADLNDVVEIVKANKSWELGYTGSGVNVSVIDSGLDTAHPDLQGKLILWKDFLNGSQTPYDDYGHGTYCAGIIAGSGSASGGLYKGIAYGVNIFSVKILNTSGMASTSDMIAAIDWSVQNQADVISMSISTYPHYQPLDDAVHNAVENGVVMVCSAGNYGSSEGSIKCPGDSPDSIAVGSYSKYGYISSFSSRGPTGDGRVKPDLIAIGESVTSARAAGVPLSPTYNQYYTSQSGTSASCPEVSAACAILLEANPGLSPADVKNTILSTADRLHTPSPNNNDGWGCLNVTAAINKVLTGSPGAAFTADTTSGYAPLTVHFTDQSTGNPTGWSWDFGDGVTSALQNPEHQYTAPGTYTVSLTVTNAYGSNTTSKTDYITVTQPPLEASFTADKTSGDYPLDVQFTDTTTGSPGPSSWDWDFGDGSGHIHTQNPTHTYTTAGDYTVMLSVTNAYRTVPATNASHINVKEHTAPNAAFDVDTISGYAPLTVHFTDQSTGNPTGWSWDFGDGTTSADHKTEHQYVAAGTYTVSLTVTNAYGSNTTSDIITVLPTSLDASFATDNTSGDYPLTVQFTDTTTGSPGPSSWDWDFGDGSTHARTQNPIHTYTSAGIFTVNLTVKNDPGPDVSTATATISVIDHPVLPVADFSGAPLSGYAPRDVQFTDASAGYPTGWSWDFGDGATSALQNPEHQYTAAGIYTVSLTVTNAYGSNTMGKAGYVTVAQPSMAASFTADKTSGSYPLAVAFTDTSTGSPAASSWDWDFGDGSAHAIVQNPTHTYTVKGNYTVTFTVKNAYVTNSTTGYVNVTKPAPVWKTYISNTGGSTISVINQTTDAVTATILTEANPWGIAFSLDGSLAYVAVESQNKVVVISTSTNTVVNNISVGTKPRGVVMSPDGRRLYVGNYGIGTISVIDTSTYTAVSTISGISKPHELWISPDGGRLYVSTYQANNVYVIDTASNTIVKTLTGSKPYFISLDPAGTRLFVANYNANNIQVYDAASLTLLSTVNTGTGPLSPVISPDGSRLYYVTDGDNKLTIAYGNNYTVIKTVTCGSGVRGIACSPDGGKVYVTNMNSGTTSIVNVTNDAGTVKNVRVGSSPYGMEQFAGYYPAPP